MALLQNFWVIMVSEVMTGGIKWNSLPGSFGPEVVSKQTVNVQVCSEAQ